MAWVIPVMVAVPSKVLHHIGRWLYNACVNGGLAIYTPEEEPLVLYNLYLFGTNSIMLLHYTLYN